MLGPIRVCPLIPITHGARVAHFKYFGKWFAELSRFVPSGPRRGTFEVRYFRVDEGHIVRTFSDECSTFHWTRDYYDRIA